MTIQIERALQIEVGWRLAAAGWGLKVCQSQQREQQ
jgi:hypothetical protein